MPGIASLRPRALDLAWVAFALVNLAAMARWPRWETIPFHFIWTSLTLLYGVRVWRPAGTFAVLGVLVVITGTLITIDATQGTETWGELFEVPLMSAMFLAMVWHARRRQAALHAVGRQAEQRAALLHEQERFMHDVSHALRTPLTIARGHLEVLQLSAVEQPPVDVALDELERIERAVDRMLLLAKAQQPGLAGATKIELEPFLEDVLMRWSETAPRVWRVGELEQGTLRAQPDALRAALDALLENAVKHTSADDAIELRSRRRDGGVAIEVADEGCGIPAEAVDGIFDRFARAQNGCGGDGQGLGLGLAIVAAIAKAHGGRCDVTTSPRGSTFSLLLPDFVPAAAEIDPRHAAETAPPLRADWADARS
jgi:signal transduction histidine kinase